MILKIVFWTCLCAYSLVIQEATQWLWNHRIWIIKTHKILCLFQETLLPLVTQAFEGQRMFQIYVTLENMCKSEIKKQQLNIHWTCGGPYGGLIKCTKILETRFYLTFMITVTHISSIPPGSSQMKIKLLVFLSWIKLYCHWMNLERWTLNNSCNVDSSPSQFLEYNG